MKTTLQPLQDNVLVRPELRPETTPGGIALPQALHERPEEGTVIAVGPGRILDNGTRKPVAVKPGDVVVFAKYGQIEKTLIDGVEHFLLREHSLLAVKE